MTPTFIPDLFGVPQRHRRLKEKDYLRNKLSRRQLQGFVGSRRAMLPLRCWYRIAAIRRSRNPESGTSTNQEHQDIAISVRCTRENVYGFSSTSDGGAPFAGISCLNPEGTTPYVIFAVLLGLPPPVVIFQMVRSSAS